VVALQTKLSSQSTLSSQEIFRLFQGIESSGDIFVVDTSVRALTVGPQSDLANYKVNVFGPQSKDSVDEIFLAVQNPITGRRDAVNSSVYPESGLPGAIYVTARDLIDSTFVPSTFNNPFNDDFVASRPKPNIDIVAHLSEPSVISPNRDDREYFYPLMSSFKGQLAGDQYYILPYYGRRYCHINLANRSQLGVSSYTLTVLGINLSIGAVLDNTAIPPIPIVAGANKAGETSLGTVTALAGETKDLVFGKNQGLFDLLSIQISDTETGFDPNSSLRVTVSDKEQ